MFTLHAFYNNFMVIQSRQHYLLAKWKLYKTLYNLWVHESRNLGLLAINVNSGNEKPIKYQTAALSKKMFNDFIARNLDS